DAAQRLSSRGPRPLHVLFRRRTTMTGNTTNTQYLEDVAKANAVKVRRELPGAWMKELAARGLLRPQPAPAVLNLPDKKTKKQEYVASHLHNFAGPPSATKSLPFGVTPIQTSSVVPAGASFSGTTSAAN
ncbi:unnamed protein product, partial [Amoebophrya sp. A25]